MPFMNKIMSEALETVLSQPFFDNPLSKKSQALIKVDAPIKVSYQKSDSNIFLLTGENASGKSYFIKWMKNIFFRII